VEKKDKRSAILINPLKLEISLSSLDIIHELWGNENKETSSVELVNSKGRIERIINNG